MKLIWNKNMYVNTVHVEDLCRAITHLLKEGAPGKNRSPLESSELIGQ